MGKIFKLLLCFGLLSLGLYGDIAHAQDRVFSVEFQTVYDRSSKVVQQHSQILERLINSGLSLVKHLSAKDHSSLLFFWNDSHRITLYGKSINLVLTDSESPVFQAGLPPEIKSFGIIGNGESNFEYTIILLADRLIFKSDGQTINPDADLKMSGVLAGIVLGPIQYFLESPLPEIILNSGLKNEAEDELRLLGAEVQFTEKFIESGIFEKLTTQKQLAILQQLKERKGRQVEIIKNCSEIVAGTPSTEGN